MNTLNDLNRIARIGAMALDFQVTGLWSGFSLSRKDGMLKRVETRTLELRSKEDSRILFSNGEAFDYQKLELISSSEWLSPKDIFKELDDEDLGHIGYDLNNGSSIHIYAYMLWCPEISADRTWVDHSTSLRLKTSNVPFRSELEEKFQWNSGPENLIKISEVQLICRHHPMQPDTDG